MGITKTDLFTEEQNAIAQMAKVLGHPARVAILQYLVKSKTCINGELISEFGIGNGISLLIFAGIAAGLPSAMGGLLELVRTGAMSIVACLFIILVVLPLALLAWLPASQPCRAALWMPLGGCCM